MQRFHITISGRVQDVDFRDFARKNALKLGLTGYVRNTRDGNVEIVAEGEQDKLRKLAELCKRGPLLAKVEKVDVQELHATQEFEGFDFRF